MDAKHGGASCPGEDGLKQEVPCNTHPCPVDCVMTDFEDDGTCSKTCGGGQLTSEWKVGKGGAKAKGFSKRKQSDLTLDLRLSRVRNT